ncbi:MAG: HD-GYP domain-containing protein [Polyangiales bacterium]
MTTGLRAPQGTEWNDVVEVLHGLTNAVMVRQLYREGHPAIARADDAAAMGFARLLERLPEIVLAVLDGEFVLCERPMPELRGRLSILAASMARLEVDCIVFSRGLSRDECTTLARTLAAAQSLAIDPKSLREEAQAGLPHALLRFAQLRSLEEDETHGTEAVYYVPLTARALADALRAIQSDAMIDRGAILDLAERIVRACEEGLFLLEPIAYAEGVDNEAAHATNVAMMTAAMALGAGLGERPAIDVTAAALLHDIGRALLPDDIRGIPEPLLDEKQKAIYRHHAFIGASALLCSGCPPLWVAGALEHHRGVDGKGHPTLVSKAPPDPLVRWIALASFIDSKRTRVGGHGDDPDRALQAAFALEGRFFGTRELRLFTRTLGMFPPGTTVELSDRRSAIVTRVSSSDAHRPQVRVICGDDAGKRAELHTFDSLDDRHHLSIVRAIAPPLVLREVAPAPSVSVTRLAIDDSEGGVDVTVIDAVETTRVEVDVPVSLPPAMRASLRLPATRVPTRTSGVYSSVREQRAEIEPESIRPVGPSSSVPPPFSRPPMAASIRPASRPPPALSLEKIPVLRVAPGELAKLPLDHRAGFVLSLIDGMTPLELIVDASGMPAADVLEIVQRLLTQAIIGLQ